MVKSLFDVLIVYIGANMNVEAAWKRKRHHSRV